MMSCLLSLIFSCMQPKESNEADKKTQVAFDEAKDISEMVSVDEKEI